MNKLVSYLQPFWTLSGKDPRSNSVNPNPPKKKKLKRKILTNSPQINHQH